jgi:hypothetical protein
MDQNQSLIDPAGGGVTPYVLSMATRLLCCPVSIGSALREPSTCPSPLGLKTRPLLAR